MYVSDLEIPDDMFGDSAQQVIDAAIDEARRCGHATLTTEHLLLAALNVEWNLCSEIVRDAGATLGEVLAEVEERIGRIPPEVGELQPSIMAKAVCRLAVFRATRASRRTVDSLDILAALLGDQQGAAAFILKQHGVDVDVVVTRLGVHASQVDIQEQQLKKRLELPATLKELGTSLNLLARQDKLAPMFGREREVERVLEVLSHVERSNSVMLLGEPGVGKTAIVEGLARRLEFEPESIPLRLRDCQIVSLRMNAVVAGTELRGTFEARMQAVIREITEHPNLILFIDEAHTLIGAGSALGAPTDAANILKSVLARGEVRIIAATTAGEYKRHIHEDEALARRFRCVHVPEPSVDETRQILYKLRPRLERNYRVRIQDAAIEMALEMSLRYVRHLHLPDKVVGWLDTAAVRAEMQGRADVTRQDLVAVVAHAAQIPEDMVARNVAARFADLEQRLQQRIVGQDSAVRAVARRLALNKGPLKDRFDRPDGVLLFLGPTGVGKTELAKALAEVLFGDDKKMVRLDMSEYQDSAVAVDKLIGMPRGIVGSQHGGVLTNQLADNPYTVVLLDEVEKASPSVLNLFLQAFDEGWLTDGRGKRIYLSDAIIIMTSNVGSQHFRKLAKPLGFLSGDASWDQVRRDVRRDAERRFPAEFLNRIDQVVLFDPLTKDDVRAIALQYLDAIRRVVTGAGKTLRVNDDAVDAIVAQGYSATFGARFLRRTIDDRIKLPLTERWHEASSFDVVIRGADIEVESRAAEHSGQDQANVIRAA